MGTLGCLCSPCMFRLCSRRTEPSPWQGAESRAAVQSVRGHQQWEALWHLCLQRLQRLLQAQRPQEAHLQVGMGNIQLAGTQGMDTGWDKGCGYRGGHGIQWGRTPIKGGYSLGRSTSMGQGTYRG